MALNLIKINLLGVQSFYIFAMTFSPLCEFSVLTALSSSASHTPAYPISDFLIGLSFCYNNEDGSLRTMYSYAFVAQAPEIWCVYLSRIACSYCFLLIERSSCGLSCGEWHI